MRAIQLVVTFSESSEASNELAFLAVLIDKARSISVTDVDVAIRCDGHVGRPVGHRRASVPGFVSFRFCRVSEGEDFFTLQGSFANHAMLVVAKIEELFASFFADG